ncbi:hypothetical protein HAX54_004769 [Datura stramonium]|uniref:Uncharacterized protein n=1 Tax=Datura stramonium TaxID=4076 RepID=A0ABS8T8S8_DATST|nr:hypothetical protein [Datura stramonium]
MQKLSCVRKIGFMVIMDKAIERFLVNVRFFVSGCRCWRITGDRLPKDEIERDKIKVITTKVKPFESIILWLKSS